MTFDDRLDRYVLSTGKAIPATSGILGISPGQTEPKLWEGGDCTIVTRGMTLEERRELARYAIGLWKAFAGDA